MQVRSLLWKKAPNFNAEKVVLKPESSGKMGVAKWNLLVLHETEVCIQQNNKIEIYPSCITNLVTE